MAGSNPSPSTQLNLPDLLAEADIKTLLMVLVTFDHDERILDECQPYITGAWDYMENIPSYLREKIITRLADLLSDINAGKRPRTATPTAELLEKMMSTFVGQPIPSEYIPLTTQQFSFPLIPEARGKHSGIASRATKSDFKVVIIGAGMSGICAAIKLKEADIPFIIFEKNDAVGGTWYENTYPGAGVDTPNHIYSFSFEPNHDWSEYFAKRDEIFKYFEAVSEKYGLYQSIRFGANVTDAVYDDEHASWKVTAEFSDGTREVVEANAVLFGVGLLNRPSVPNLQGLEKFEGPVLHTAQWDSSVKWKGKRVGMIGTGASGMQVGPTIAPEVEHLTIFQRSPHWVTYNPNYHRRVTPGKEWALKNIPYYADWYRFQLFWATADSLHASLHVDPTWPYLDRSLNETNEKMRQALIASVESQIGDDPELLAKVIPTYPPYGKRMLRDNHWYRTLKRENVSLVTERIAELQAGAVITSDSQKHDIEVLVLATGFSVGQVLGPINVHGAHGIDLRSIWGEDDPRAYLGITVPNFPNLFIMAGPNTSPAHGGSAIFNAECQVNYIVQALQILATGEYSAVDVRKDVHDAYNERVDAQNAKMVWTHQGVNSWYKNRHGRVFASIPWRMVDYWSWTRKFEPGEYNLR
ncbi:flavin-containing monooxygenase [Mesorhizobium shangrilense]|uniref:NAD(P)/FAD-dependent oxidoreductase n=1 Tax=Mesorhizobium shangrilense TaxID=460060 RepID=A0ABV2DGV0_9HYPH